jgi:hypothetical protein
MEHNTLPTVATQGPQRHTGADPDAALVVGSWWRVRDAQDILAEGVDPVPAHGVVRAIVAVHRIDGAIHSIDLQQHPHQGKGSTRVLRDAFLERCVHEANGEALRAMEQAALLGELGQASGRIAQGPSTETLATMIRSIAASAPAPSEAATGQLPLALTGGRNTQALSTAAGKAVAEANARAAWAKDQVAAMGALTHRLTVFQLELAAIVGAQANAQAELARTTLDNLATLTLFLGERQTITTLVEGASAPAHEPLHFFQQMLYLDEELAVAWPKDEGFTWKDGMGHLGDLLSVNPDVVSRMLPHPRSVAIARVRRNPRPLGDVPADWGAVFQSINEAEWDKALLVLVRDGDRVAMVEADEDTAGAQRLFPSRAEIDALYRERGWHGKEPITITPDDLAYVESRAAHAQRALFYKRFLVLFWGLHARTGFFGPFMPTDLNWFDPAVQEAHFRFVHDEEMGLAAPGPNAIAWMAAGVQTAGVGTRIAIDTKVAIQYGDLVGGYADVDHRRLKGHPRDRFLTAVVESDGLNRFVTIPMIEGRKTVRRKLMMGSEGRSYAPRGLCCVDDLTPSVIAQRLDSHRDRMDYSDYVPLLRWLRPQVAASTAAATEALQVPEDTLAQPAWVAARRAVKDGATKRIGTLARAYAKGLDQAVAPALVDTKGQAHTLAPWQHPAFPGMPSALWSAGGQLCTAEHPAPNGLVQVGVLPKVQGQRLDLPFHRLDLPGWCDAVAAPSNGDAIGAALDGHDPEQAMAWLVAFVDHNRAQKAPRVLPASLTWALGVGVWSDPGRGTRLWLVAAVHDPAALALTACGEEATLAQLKRLYRDPERALERARIRAARGWRCTIGPANPKRPPPLGAGLDWEGAGDGQEVPWEADEGAPRGTDGGMLLGGAVQRPGQFLFGGPSSSDYTQRAQSARFWLRSGARGWLAPRFHPEGWSQDGIDWFEG